MAKTPARRCPPSSATGEVEASATLSHHYMPIRVAKLKAATPGAVRVQRNWVTCAQLVRR